MADYDFKDIEERWQKEWARNKTFKAENNSDKPKYYALDMFPYPSGAGLHVGHPLGYIASDIISRYRRNLGYNVLHPMGFDAFGLPAEQYAIQTGQHPAVTTEKNIATYKEQLKKIGFSFDWDREVRTSDKDYYKWTQWIFLQLFGSWYDQEADKARPIDELISIFENNGNEGLKAACDDDTPSFSAADWNSYSEKQQQEILLKYRLTYLAETTVNWCPELGTVLANEEVKDGYSERGGHPVVRKKMQQWSMRISAYAERLLNDLEKIDWTDSVKEMQRHWIGRSIGAQMTFENGETSIDVFTTRPDTIFGVTFLTLAPESELVEKLTTADQQEKVNEYVTAAKNRSERDRMSDVKTVSGVFSGSYAKHPFSGEDLPIWIADYVLAGYGTGAVMAVPAHDTRDHAFAKHFDLPIIQVIENEGADVQKEAFDAKEGKTINSDFLNGLEVKEAIEKAISALEQKGIGRGRTNYRLRDAIFSRQRYWGEPVPIYFKDGLPYPYEGELPLELPAVDKYLPTESGEPPLARADNWKTEEGYPFEQSTMPGWAGSSWYFFRYMDPENQERFVGKEAQEYWENVDLYIGGTEHATGHLLYARFWTKFLYDLRLVTVDEPFKKLINQGMIQGVSAMIFVYKDNEQSNRIQLNRNYDPREIEFTEKDVNRGVVKAYFSLDSAEYDNFIRNSEWFSKQDLKSSYRFKYIPIKYCVGNKFDESQQIKFDEENRENSALVCKNGYWLKGKFYDFYKNEVKHKEDFLIKREVEKMSKSKLNVVNPDRQGNEEGIIELYGADTLRLYEMFLGPLEQSKPWNTNGIEGVSKFLKKLWRLYHDSEGNFSVSEEAPDKKMLKSLHTLIKKAKEDLQNFSFNTSVSAFMICVNELTALKCNHRQILEPLAVVISPFAPHITEELWKLLGKDSSICHAPFPEHDEKYLIEDEVLYPISVNGKVRAKLSLPATFGKEEVEKAALAEPEIQKWMEGKQPKKVIVVPGKIVNVVV